MRLLFAATVAWGLCSAYTLRFNPEIRFFSQLSDLQMDWAKKMEREHGHKLVVFGGSSCTFSIRGEQMLQEQGLPAVNRGLGAGMDVKVITSHAVQGLRRDDTLIVALESGKLTTSCEALPLGIQFSYAKGHAEWATRARWGCPNTSWVSSLLALRPGSYHLFTLFGKAILRRPFYRYRVSDALPSGWMQTSVRNPLRPPADVGEHLSEAGRSYLISLRQWCDENGIRVAYSLPWVYTPRSFLDDVRQKNARLLAELAEVIPILKDPALGTHSVAEDFADTELHLSEEGSRLRTQSLGRQIEEWSLWSMKELKDIAAGADTKRPPGLVR